MKRNGTVGGEGKGREKRRGEGCLASGYDETATSKMVCIKRGGRTGRAKEETVWRTREKKARYTCLKERRDTHSTVTKHPSFGRESKERKEDGREEREGEYGERSLGRVVEMMARKGERDGGGCVRVSKIFPFLPCFLVGFLFRDFVSSRPVTRADENYSRNLDDLWTLYTPVLLEEDEI